MPPLLLPKTEAQGWVAPMAAPTPAPAPKPAAQNQLYWVGSDGNVWFRDSTGKVSNQGTPIDLMDNGFNSSMFSAEATRINDPNPGRVSTTDMTYGSSGGSSAPTYKDTTAARNATQVSIDSLGTVLNNALTGADGEYNSVIDAYNSEDAENLTKYKGDVEKNEISRDEGTQASLLSAARGSRGLYSTLASLGALGGTGRTLANRAISTEANAELGEGEKSFETNVSNLFNSRSALEKQEKQRRLDAEKIKTDAKQSAEFDYYKGNQDLAKEMAGLWTDAGNTAEAGNWLNRSSTYTPEMAKRTKVTPGQYAKTPLAYSAPEMSKYLGGQSSTAVNVAANSPINGALYTSTKKRDEL